MPDRTLPGQVALVTGGGKRIGRAIALELARAGADVVVHVNRSTREGGEVVREIEALGRRAALVTADQRDVEAIEAACLRARDQLGTPSILVNNAAVWPRGDLARLTVADYDEALDANLRGPFFWVRRLGLWMKEAGRGVIVSLADVTAERPLSDAIPYCMAKAGIVTMTYGLARALAPEVRVCAVAPGPIVYPEGYSEDEIAADRAATLRGVEGSPEELARAVRFLCENGNITGVCLPVDGGFRFGI